MFGATLLGMAYIAEVCDHLRTLKLDFDTSPEAMKEAQWPLDAPLRGTRPNSKVTTLDVHMSPVHEADVAAVAAVLVGSFTSLSTILQNGKESTGTWRNVQDLLPTLYAEHDGNTLE
ncbi:uncharacterized protein B0H18DRAFT_1112789 [Fomitopsis serialis]|uniref:uncharacterized protein n=1 Tax=Fomitopsis serialis TaxID=139415 RepID=UPI0020074B6B|nr:uncharacterized protein B0H18DRAFT_1112789 [Neoantrodia serialis]KAH9938659.1 hypothetical protein B0H18DRAFT_1112789 [Neoantrodia serialis]